MPLRERERFFFFGNPMRGLCVYLIEALCTPRRFKPRHTRAVTPSAYTVARIDTSLNWARGLTPFSSQCAPGLFFLSHCAPIFLVETLWCEGGPCARLFRLAYIQWSFDIDALLLDRGLSFYSFSMKNVYGIYRAPGTCGNFGPFVGLSIYRTG